MRGSADPRGEIEAWMNANPRGGAPIAQAQAPQPSLFTPSPAAPPSLFNPQPAPQMPNLSAALPTPQPMQPASLFNPPPAPPPSTTFMEQAHVNPGTPAPAPIPIVAAPSGGLIQATPFTPAPEMPGYAQARTGNPFRAPQAPPTANLWDALAAPVLSPEEEARRNLGKSSYANWY
jgi:hypothetical protein